MHKQDVVSLVFDTNPFCTPIWNPPVIFTQQMSFPALENAAANDRHCGFSSFLTPLYHLIESHRLPRRKLFCTHSLNPVQPDLSFKGQKFVCGKLLR